MTIDITALRADIDLANASEGYYVEVGVDTLGELCDAAEALVRVRAGHEPMPCTDNPWDPVQERCASDEQAWPCDTERAINGEGS